MAGAEYQHPRPLGAKGGDTELSEGFCMTNMQCAFLAAAVLQISPEGDIREMGGIIMMVAAVIAFFAWVTP